MINFVMMSANFHHMEDIVRLAARLGVDQVNFKQCEVIRGEHGRGFGLFGAAETKQIRQLQKNLSRAIRLARNLGVLTTALAFTPSERPVCEQDPRDSAFICYDGTVAPCISLANGGITTFLGREMNMPPVNFGRVTEKGLLELWQTDACRFFRERFENRVRAYEEAFLSGLIGDSRHTPERLIEAAVKRMPKAPEGCQICHYLYSI
jgi:MoaA/NifB/PqqE/SkfB family radical SAM enzyme